MTPTAATPRPAAWEQPAAHRSRGDVARGALAALVLTVLLLGLPVLLVIFSPSGFLAGVPAWGEMVALLTRPDDGSLFLGALALIGWLAWACFAASVIAEIVAVVRGLPAPHLPVLGLTQGAAAALVTTAAVLVTTPTTGLTAPAQATTLSAPVLAPEVSAPAPRPDPAAAAAPQKGPPGHQVETGARRHPAVIVKRGDTLWGLAATHLGDGERWREIYDLNSGQPQHDGHRLTQSRWILAGWTLRLPADATGVPTPAHAAQAGEANDPAPQAAGVYLVQQGDTLWDIAAAHLGDPARYREIYQLNAGRAQMDGQALHDPDQITPGWRLVLTTPSPPATTHPTDTGERHLATPPTQTPTAEPGRSEQPRPPTRRAASPVPGAGHRGGAIPAGDKATDTTRVDGDGWDSHPAAMSVLIAGVGALAAAGAVGELSRRRRRQQRLRRPGERLPMPEPDTTDATLEQALRGAPQPLTLTALKQALRAMAISCARRERALPRLGAVLVGAESVELLLVGDDDAPEAPFNRIAANRWAAPIAAVADQPSEAADDDIADPYPALVSLGVTDETVVLINLEAAGTLTITGEPERSTAVLRALVAELATSELSTGCSLTLGPDFADLAEVCDTTHVNLSPSPTALATSMAAHSQALRAVLDSASVPDVHEARARDVAEDAWTPEIVVSATALGDPAPAAWSGVTALTCADRSGPGWNLQLRPGNRARLEPLALDVQPSSLDTATYHSLIALLRRADEPTARHQPAEGTAQDVERTTGSDDTAAVLGCLPAGPDSPLRPEPVDAELSDAPRLLILGPVTVDGADNSTGAVRRGRATELVTYLALHPGASAHQINEVMWPGQRVTKQNRNSFVSRVRAWLGQTPDGEPYLAHVNDGGDYRLQHGVSCDWHDFLRLARAGLSRGQNGADELEAALKLVRGRPFLGIDPADYTWAEADTQDMISTIVDVAHTLAKIRLEQGDARAAQAAAAKGLLAEPVSELLYRDAMRACLLRGDTQEIARLRAQLMANLSLIDPDTGLEAETIEILADRSPVPK